MAAVSEVEVVLLVKEAEVEVSELQRRWRAVMGEVAATARGRRWVSGCANRVACASHCD